MARKVTAIPATLTRFTSVPITEERKKRVAGYARVSTDQEEQETSYEAQVDYYTSYIQNHEDWEFVKVYTDEGISGTSTKKRLGFMEMIGDALSGKIDLIVTKSISRFARNTVDSLTTIRKLKEKGVEVFFEKENIWTLDSKSEVIITIMSSIAQEESRSISENVTWGKRKSFADGNVYVQTNGMLGYKKGKNGEIEIDEAEAEVIRFIFSSYISGKSMTQIAEELDAKGIKTAKGKSHWGSGQIRNILRNEKYTGNALLQKTYSVDFLTKKRRTNNGEVPQFYVEDSHPAIVSKDAYDIAQSMMKNNDSRSAYKGNIFSGKIICADCSSCFAPKTWHSKDKYKRTIWQCAEKFKGEKKCTTPHLTENEIKMVVVKAVNDILPRKRVLINEIESSIESTFSNTELEENKLTLEGTLNAVCDSIDNLIKGNSTELQDQETYSEKYNELSSRYLDLKKEIEKVDSEIANNVAMKAKIRKYVDELERSPELVSEFSSEMFTSLIEKVVVKTKDDITVVFKDGSSLKESL